MATRNKRAYREEPVEERPLTLDEALDSDRASVIYEKLSEIVKSHGVDLLLKVRLISSSTYKTAGFVGDVNTSDEVQNFIENPEGFLKSNYGEGSYRIDIIDGTSKKYVSHLKIDISSPKEKINNPPPTMEIIRDTFKEGVSLGKASLPSPNNQSPLDLTKLVELILVQQQASQEREEKILEKIRADENRLREREEKRLEVIRSDENRLREKELAMIEKAYANNVDVTAHMKPFLDSMGVYGKMLSNSIGMVERALDFKERFNAPATEGSFVERLLIGLGEKFLDSNPNLLKGLSLPPNNPILTKPIVTKNISSENNQPTEKTSSQPEVTNPTHEANKPNQPTVEQIFFNCLYQKLEKGQALDDPGLSADELLSEIEFFEAKGIMSEAQIKIYFQYLSSENLIPHLESIMPNLGPYKPFLLKFQQEFKKLLEEMNEEETQTTN